MYEVPPPAPNPLTATAPITLDGSSEARRAHGESRTAIMLLQERWPAAFPQTPQQVRPLIAGLTSLIAATLDWSHPYTRAVLRTWKLRPAYCHAVLAHPVRFDLDGNPTDQPIDEDARTQAKARLATWAHRRRRPAPQPGERVVASAVDHDPQQQRGTTAQNLPASRPQPAQQQSPPPALKLEPAQQPSSPPAPKPRHPLQTPP